MGDQPCFFAATCNGNLERHEQGREEDDQHTCRTHIADHNPVQSLGAEPLVLFDFTFNICSFYYISHQNTGHQCYNRHHQIVADKVEEIQHLLAEDGEVRPDAVAKDRQQTDQKGASGSGTACRNRSSSIETTVSMREMEEVSAASETSRKKTVPTI